MQSTGIDELAMARLQDSISVDNIAQPAKNVLQLPEFLYMHSALEELIAETSGCGESVYEGHAALKMCVVISHRIKVNYHHIWDTEKLHQQHVRTELCSSYLCNARGHCEHPDLRLSIW